MFEADIGRISWLIVSVAWLIGAFGSSAILAFFYRRLHPDLSFYKLWAFWAIVMSLVVAALFAAGIV